MAKTKYTLYLDESTTHNGSYKNETFCMAGVIISNNDYSSLESDLNNIKKNIWGDHPCPSDIILHQMEIRNAQKTRKSVNSDYMRFRSNSYNRLLFDGLSGIFNSGKLVVIGACVDIDKLTLCFGNRFTQDKSLIALQLMLENYCHFLCCNDGVGEIVYESIDSVADEKMRTRFYNIKLMGSMYIDTKTMRERLSTMNFYPKNMNNAGLQIADFVPNYFARKNLEKSPQRFNIDDELRRCRYDGNGLNMRNRFGVKCMP